MTNRFLLKTKPVNRFSGDARGQRSETAETGPPLRGPIVLLQPVAPGRWRASVLSISQNPPDPVSSADESMNLRTIALVVALCQVGNLALSVHQAISRHYITPVYVVQLGLSVPMMVFFFYIWRKQKP